MGKTNLIDLSARIEKVCAADKNKVKTKFIVGPLSARQLFTLFAKHEKGAKAFENLNAKSSQTSIAAGALLALDFVKYGLREVKGELGKGFKLEDDYELGFECKAVSNDYLDTLPMEISMEIGGEVGAISQAGAEEKKG